MTLNSFILGNVGFALVLALSAKITSQFYRAFRRRKSGYGTVFDSYTNQPVALAMISLKNLHGQIVRTTVADNVGRYRLLAPRGEYFVAVGKPGYSFPSKHVTKEDNHSVYGNLLPSSHIIIRDYGAITKNIPLDPEGGRRATNFWRRYSLGKRAQETVSIIIPLAAVAYAVWRRDLLTWSIFALYAVVTVRRLMLFHPPEPPFGTVTDAGDKKPLAKAVVRIFDTRFNKLLETQVTTDKGRYAFIVNRGSYLIRAEKRGYRTVVLKFPRIKNDGFLLAKEIKMKKLNQRAASPKAADTVRAA